MSFYDLPELQRVALTRQAISERRTLIERWSTLEKPEATPWGDRAEIAASLLQACGSVADLGCGIMLLRNDLLPDVRYVPVDVVARDEETLIVDLNRETLPSLNVDAWAALGLLEYLFDVRRLLGQLSGTVVTSYNPIDLSSQNRLSHAWVNDYDTDELEGLFLDSGWIIQKRVTFGSQRILKLVN